MVAAKRPDIELTYALDREIDTLRKHREVRGIPPKGPGQLLLASWSLPALEREDRDDTDYQLIAEMISWFDIVAVQKITAGDPGIKGQERVLQHLPSSWDRLLAPAATPETQGFFFDSARVTFSGDIGPVHIPTEQLQPIKLPGIEQPFTGFQRPPVYARFDCDDYPVALVNVHLHFGGFAGKNMERRALEIHAVTDWAVQHHKSNPDVPVVVVGTFHFKHQIPTSGSHALVGKGLHLPERSAGFVEDTRKNPAHPQAMFTVPPEVAAPNVFDFDNALLHDDAAKMMPGKWRNYLRRHFSSQRIFWTAIKTAPTPDFESVASNAKRLSDTVHAVLKIATTTTDTPIDAKALFIGILAVGRAKENSIAGFIYRRFTELVDFMDIPAHLFNLDNLPSPTDTDTRSLEPDLASQAFLNLAEKIALGTTGQNTIASRHLLAALSEAIPQQVVEALAKKGFPKNRLRREFMGEVFKRAPGDDRNYWRDLLLSGVAPDQTLSRLAAVLSDKPSRTDRLYLTREIEAFSTLLASNGLTPPLAIGLFGGWGAGKSFFMERIFARIESLCALARQAPDRNKNFHHNIAQIRFNAWHFVDANLWASLITRIFDGLAVHLAPDRPDTFSRQRGAIVAKLNRFRKMVTEKETAQTAAHQQLSEAQEAHRLQVQAYEAALEEQQKRQQQSPLTAIAWPAIRQMLSTEGLKALQRLNNAAAVSTGEELENLIHSARTTNNLFKKLKTITKGRMLVFTLAVTAVTALGWLIGEGLSQLPDSFYTRIAAAVAPWTAFVASAAESVRRAVAGFNRNAQTLADEWEAKGAQARAQVEAAHAEALVQARQLIDKAQNDLEQTRREHYRAQQSVDQLQHELDAMNPDRMFTQFIKEKAASDTYRSRLGFISQIREDLEDLTDLFYGPVERLAPQEAHHLLKGDARSHYTQQIPRVERIILYIDDLDRCPPKRVAEVLQAVHLLLAFRLFVVVVAVDPRWLHRALEVHYPELLSTVRNGNHPDDEAGRAATPREYLEKIFQIPYVLPAMQRDGFRNLVASLTRGAKDKAKHETRSGVATSNSTATKPAQGDVTAHVHSESQNTLPEKPSSSSREAKTANPEKRPRSEVTPSEADQPPSGNGRRQTAAAHRTSSGKTGRAPAAESPKLSPNPLSEKEIDFMQELHPLLRTPRSTKRLLNLYQLLRATVEDFELDAFIDAGAAAAGFRPTLIFMGVIIGFPEESLALMACVDNAPDDQLWSELLATIRPQQVMSAATDTPKKSEPDGKTRKPYRSKGLERELTADEALRWLELDQALDLLRRETEFDAPVVVFKEWAARVRRYSFQAALEQHIR